MSENEEIKQPATKSVHGKGVDIGTAFIKCAYKEDNDIVFSTQRNLFYEVEQSEYTNALLGASDDMHYIKRDDKTYIIGNEALKFANMFNSETRRPLRQGVISPKEEEALPIIKKLLDIVVGPSNKPNEVCYFSVPSEPVDVEFNVIYHTKMMENFLKEMGYAPKPINEAYGVVLAELQDENFTGVGISFGGGMVNVCLSFRSVPFLKFSIARGGDWVDEQVAKVTGETTGKVIDIKEKEFGFNNVDQMSKIQTALEIYYSSLFEYVIDNFNKKFAASTNIPQINDPLTIVLAGGSAMVPGFEKVFAEVVNNTKMPFKVDKVILSKDPHSAPARGALVAAGVEESI